MNFRTLWLDYGQEALNLMRGIYVDNLKFSNENFQTFSSFFQSEINRLNYLNLVSNNYGVRAIFCDEIVRIFLPHVIAIEMTFRKMKQLQNEDLTVEKHYEQTDTVGIGGFDIQNQDGQFSKNNSNGKEKTINNANYFDRANMLLISIVIRIVDEIRDTMCKVVYAS